MKKRFLMLGVILQLVAATCFAATYTTNLNLKKPARGEAAWDTSVNNNMDVIDSAYDTMADDINDVAGQISDSPEVYFESGTFNFTTGDEITLPKAVSAITEYGVAVIPTSNAGAIGDIYVTKTTTTITVKCSENNTTDTFQAVIWYKGELNAYGNSQYREWIVSPDTSITDHGDATDDGSLAWVFATLSGEVNVRLPGNHTYQLLQDVTVPAGVTIKPDRGAVIATQLSVAGGGAAWTVVAGSIYEMTLANEPATLYESGVELTKVAGVGSIDAAGKWAWNAGQLMVWTTGSVDPDSLGADLLKAGYSFDATLGHVEDNGGQMFSASPGDVTGLAETRAYWWGTGNKAVRSAVLAASRKTTVDRSYSIDTEIEKASVTGFTLEVDDDATLTAAAAMTSMLNISGASSHVTVKGGIWDCDSNADNAILLETSTGSTLDDIKIVDLEILNAAGNGLSSTVGTYTGNAMNRVRIQHVYSHDNGGHGIYIVKAKDLTIRDCETRNTNLCGIFASKIQGGVIKDNHVFEPALTSTANNAVGIKSIFSTGMQISGNNVEYSQVALPAHTLHGIWADTLTTGDISGNSVYGCEYGIRAEVCKNVSVGLNHAYKSHIHGIYVDGRDDEVQDHDFDNTTGVTAGANVVLSTDAADKEEGTGSMVATMGAGHGAGILWYYDYGSAQDFQTYNMWRFFIQVSTDLAYGDLEFRISSSAALADAEIAIPLPALLSASGWIVIRELFGDNWTDISQVVRSVGIYDTAGIAAGETVKLDDLNHYVVSEDNVVAMNAVWHTKGDGIRISDLSRRTIVALNNVDGAGLANDSAIGQYGIQVRSNSATTPVYDTVLIGNLIRNLGGQPALNAIRVASVNAGAHRTKLLGNQAQGTWIDDGYELPDIASDDTTFFAGNSEEGDNTGVFVTEASGGKVKAANITADTATLDVGNRRTYFRLTPDADAWEIYGVSDGYQGREICIHNNHATYTILLMHESGSAGAATERMHLPSGATVTLNPYGSACLFYDNTSSRWKLKNN